MTREDRFTNTPEDAAAFERRYGVNGVYDDGPDWSDVAPDSFETADEEWIHDAELDDRMNDVVHPDHCHLPPGHAPWWVWYDRIRGLTFIQNCPLEPVGG